MSSSLAARAAVGIQSQDERGSISPLKFCLVLGQLGLLLLLMRQFQIESAAFLRLALLAFGGFAVHAWLPLRWRMPFFVALSLVGLVLVMGAHNAFWMVAIGLLLIGICHLPLPLYARVTLLMGVAVLLVLQRAGLFPFPWSEAIWPILGAMFMFRLMVYFYDLRHEKQPTSPTGSLAYFFMLPNACFPLFPVVDYKTFLRSHFDDDAYRIYQSGIDWMLRGVIQLILYRVVYYHLTLAPHEVGTPAELSQYLVANFLLYLRVSGLFHLIVGMLYLFGFRLPETHNRYLLASSFTDFWRRINIYWKDFMQKLFYYPAVFRLRALGTEKALMVATLYVFLMTWFLHAYQWFWLRGTVLFVAQDILFWTILGVLVVANSLWEIRHGRKRSLGKPVRNARTIAIQIAKTYGTFWFICVLWSFWTTESLEAWFSLWAALGGEYSWGVLIFPLVILAVITLGSLPNDSLRNQKGKGEQTIWTRSTLATMAMLVVLVGLSVESIHSRIGTGFGTFVHSLRSGQLSRLDMAKLERGYYENLLDVNRFNSQLWEMYSKKPENWLDIDSANMKRFVGGFHETEMIPSFVRETKYGNLSTNAFGMRDQPYAQTPAPGTHRSVLLGASSVMGWGVGDGETFEALLEQRINQDWSGRGIEHFEMLNMGIAGYQPPQQMVMMDKALAYRPDTVFYIATGREIKRSVDYLVQVVGKGTEIPYPELRQIVAEAGVDAGTDAAAAVKQLLPHGEAVIRAVYKHIAGLARERGIVPVWVFLPQVPEGEWQQVLPETRRAATDAGFRMIDLSGVFAGREPNDVRLAEWDAHPNVLGHQLLADKLYAELARQRDAIFKSPTNNR